MTAKPPSNKFAAAVCMAGLVFWPNVAASQSQQPVAGGGIRFSEPTLNQVVANRIAWAQSFDTDRSAACRDRETFRGSVGGSMLSPERIEFWRHVVDNFDFGTPYYSFVDGAGIADHTSGEQLGLNLDHGNFDESMLSLDYLSNNNVISSTYGYENVFARWNTQNLELPTPIGSATNSIGASYDLQAIMSAIEQIQETYAESLEPVVGLEDIENRNVLQFGIDLGLQTRTEQDVDFLSLALAGLPQTIDDDGLRGGDDPHGGNPHVLQLKVDCFLLNGEEWIGDVQNDENYNLILDCSEYTDESKNHCFLPVVSIIEDDQNRSTRNKCAGTIVGEYHVLTAAHCACRPPKFVSIGTGVRPSLASYTSLSSGHFVMGLQHGEILRKGLVSSLVEVDDVILFNEVEQDFLCQEVRTASADDLALLRLSLQHPFPRGTRAVVMTSPPSGTPVNIVGFARDPAAQNGLANMKRYGSSTLVASDGQFHTVFDEAAQIRETCSGDSGSGLYIRLANGRLGIFGVLSAGKNNCESAGNNFYVQISEGVSLDWLQTNVPGLIKETDPIYAEDFRDCIGLGCEGEKVPGGRGLDAFLAPVFGEFAER